MSKKIYNKLVRDKIPEVIKNKGGVPKISILGETEFREALKIKMIEEAKELLEAQSDEDVLSELSDVEELARTIAENYGISNDEIEKRRIEKFRDRGGFKKKLFLEYVEEK